MNALEKGQRLTELVKAFRLAQDGGNINEYVSKGFMNEVEFASYKAKWDVESEAYQAGQKAANAVPVADTLSFLESEGLIEYVALKRQLAAVQAELAPIREAIGATEAFRPHYGNITLSQFSDLVEVVQTLLNEMTTSPRYRELLAQERVLYAEIAPKERANTRVHRLLSEAYDNHRATLESARAKASNAVLHTNADIVHRGKRAEQLMNARIAHQRANLVKQMREVLGLSNLEADNE